MIPFEVKYAFELDPVQTRILDIARFYDVVYQLGEDISNTILDSLSKTKRWYENFRENIQKERKKSKSSNDNRYDKDSPYTIFQIED